MDKEDVVHIYKGILLNHKKEQSNAIFSNMNSIESYKFIYFNKVKFAVRICE